MISNNYDSVLCANNCGRLAVKRSMLCKECYDFSRRKNIKWGESEHELDIVTEVLSEKIRGETVLQQLIEERGFFECVACGRPSLPNRFYCSDRCREGACGNDPIKFEFNGVLDTVSGHCRRIGILPSTVSMRISRGVSPLKALQDNIWSYRSAIEIDGISDTVTGHCRRFGFNEKTVFNRIYKGKDPVKALSYGSIRRRCA